MKITVRTLVMLSLLLMSSLAVTAQKNLLLQDVRPLMAIASDAGYNLELSTEYSMDSYGFYMEEKLPLKDWMMQTKAWETEGRSGLALALRPESEASVPVEDWMVRLSRTGQTRLEELVKVEREEPIQFQKWMICCTDWFSPSR
jgi:hypothetical protein